MLIEIVYYYFSLTNKNRNYFLYNEEMRPTSLPLTLRSQLANIL